MTPDPLSFLIVSLNLPDDLIAFIDGQATTKKLSRSAWATPHAQISSEAVSEIKTGQTNATHYLVLT